MLIRTNFLWKYVQHLNDRQVQQISLCDLDKMESNKIYVMGADDCELKSINLPENSYLYAVNNNFVQDRVFPIPIGTVNAHYAMKAEIKPKKKLLYTNFSLQNHPSRPLLMNIFKDKKFGEVVNPNEKQDAWGEKGHIEYFEEMSEHIFCLCPPGYGLDTYRVWEALSVGTIPIVIDGPFYKQFFLPIAKFTMQQIISLEEKDLVELAYITSQKSFDYNLLTEHFYINELHKTLNYLKGNVDVYNKI